MFVRIFSIICSLATCFVAAYLDRLDYLFSINIFFIPIGAIYLGLIAGSGYYLSTFITNRVLNIHDFWIIVMLSLFGIYLIYFLKYLYRTNENFYFSQFIHHSIKFSYCSALIFKTNAVDLKTCMTQILKKDVNIVDKIGIYLINFINSIGFICANIYFVTLIRKRFKCNYCLRYLKGWGSIKLYFKNTHTLNNYLNNIAEIKICDPNFNEKVLDLEKKYKQDYSFWKNINALYQWQIKKCGGCQIEFLCGKAKIPNPNHRSLILWIEKTRYRKRIEIPLKKTETDEPFPVKY